MESPSPDMQIRFQLLLITRLHVFGRYLLGRDTGLNTLEIEVGGGIVRRQSLGRSRRPAENCTGLNPASDPMLDLTAEFGSGLWFFLYS